ncbi:hypothetical protein ACQP2U_07825 [Nocardia sp. CA-084685]|uniref:hypothetical protein n=1 Tax=Nocardia sp. CA-084685 TaxID=3239970 RepID=UPI003D98FFD3
MVLAENLPAYRGTERVIDPVVVSVNRAVAGSTIIPHTGSTLPTAGVAAASPESRYSSVIILVTSELKVTRPQVPKLPSRNPIS